MRGWCAATLVLCGCESQICAILGDYTGAFDGDLTGELAATIAEDPADVEMALADLSLDDGTDVLSGSSPVRCDSGELTIDLTSTDGLTTGTVTGLLSEGSGAGDYALDSGALGTWSY